jgi:hypothetical protein
MQEPDDGVKAYYWNFDVARASNDSFVVQLLILDHI